MPEICDIIRIYKVRYEWDEKKNQQNQRKHGGISFELATLVFEDPGCLMELDRVDEAGEQRWLTLGAFSCGTRHGIDCVGSACLQGGLRWRRDYPNHLGTAGR
jgi:hypothetical protein